mmetsp:Transcript_111417/g.240034  ORF Transcript_111417/g.240034 Transcript_111417/m.240034 type:complete len:161 (-) Transcript_111417:15-497(-)
MKVEDLDMNLVDMGQFRGKLLLVVNLSSKCKYSSVNMKGLAALAELFPKDKFEVLGFPCGQFMLHQVCDNRELKKYSEDLKLNFRVFGKLMVNGPYTSPLYQFLRSNSDLYNSQSKCCDNIAWNFEKFLIDQDGKVLFHWNSGEPTPYTLVDTIKKHLVV